MGHHNKTPSECWDRVLVKMPVRSTHIRDDRGHRLFSMAKKTTAETVADNLNWLKDAAGYSFRDMEIRSGIKKSTVQRILTGGTTATIDQAQALAEVFGLDGWHLLLPNLPRDLQKTKTLSSLVPHYLDASSAGRDNIDRVAEMEARYSKPPSDALGDT